MHSHAARTFKVSLSWVFDTSICLQQPKKARAASGFSLFVKNNFSTVKAKSRENMTHGDVMKELSRLYKQDKTMGMATGGTETDDMDEITAAASNLRLVDSAAVAAGDDDSVDDDYGVDGDYDDADDDDNEGVENDTIEDDENDENDVFCLETNIQPLYATVNRKSTALGQSNQQRSKEVSKLDPCPRNKGSPIGASGASKCIDLTLDSP